MKFIPFYNCIRCKKKKKCKYCDSVIKCNMSDSFCDKSCHIMHIYQDSFRSINSDQQKYLICIDL